MKKRRLWHLSHEDSDRIRELRFAEDPRVRKSKEALARMFGVTPMYVGMIAPLPEDQKDVRIRRGLRKKRPKGAAAWTTSQAEVAAWVKKDDGAEKDEAKGPY